MIGFQIPGEPVAFARAGKNGTRHYTPAPQRNFMGVIALCAKRAMGAMPPMTGPLWLQVRATYQHPASWPQKRKDATLWKTSKPDASNIVKLLEDACNTIVWEDDAQVARAEVDKIYGPIASLTVTVSSLTGEVAR